jgi:general secretion pathway protein M
VSFELAGYLLPGAAADGTAPAPAANRRRAASPAEGALRRTGAPSEGQEVADET